MAKAVLDACCGFRMFWFDKSHPAVFYMDNQELEDVLKLAPVAPLFGQRAGKTHWLVFMKGGQE